MSAIWSLCDEDALLASPAEKASSLHRDHIQRIANSAASAS